MSGGQGQCYVGPLDSTATSSSGITVGDYVYVWGFQAEQSSSAHGYLPTGSSASPALATIPATTTNLLQNSSNVGSTNWGNLGSASVSNVTGPNGVASAAQQITAPGSTTGYYNTSMTSVSGTVYTSSGYFQWVSSGTLLRFVAAAGSFTGAGDAYIEFNGSTGAFSSKSSFITSYTIVPINGWWRVTATWTAASSGAGAGVAAYSASSNASVFNVFGMQVETGAVANPYVPTTANSTASAAIPRITNLGLWEEPQSINLDNATTASSPFVATGTTTTDPAGGNTARIQSQTSNFQWGAAAPWYSGNTYTVSFYVKSGGGSPALQYLQIPFSTGNVAGSAYANFDIINGTVTQSSGVTASITAVLGASGWFRCAVTVLCSTTNGLQSYMWPITNGTQGFAGTAPSTASYYTLWGYQNEQSSTATNYILGNANGNAQRGADVNTLTFADSTTSATVTVNNLGAVTYPASGVTNLLQYSTSLTTNAPWVPQGTITTTTAVVAPNGTLTAFKYASSVAASQQNVYNGTSPTTVANTPYTFSAYFKYNGYQYALLQIGAYNGGTGCYAVADLINGTINTTGNLPTGGYVSSSITSVGNGWYRVSVTGQFSSLTTLFPYIYSGAVVANLISSTAGSTFAGDGVSGYYIWGPQLEAGSTANSYVSTTTASATIYGASPFNLGSSSGGAWVGSYIASFLTNSSSTAGAGTVNGVANVAGASQLALSGAGAVNGVANVAGGSQTFRTAAGTVNGIANVAGASPAAANSGAGTVNGIANVAGASLTTLTAAGVVNGVANVAGAGGVFALGAGTVNGLASVAGISSLSLAAAGTVNGVASVNGASPIVVTTSVSLTGVVGVCTVSSVNVWGSIPENQLPGWTLVNENQTPVWTPVPH